MSLCLGRQLSQQPAIAINLVEGLRKCNRNHRVLFWGRTVGSLADNGLRGIQSPVYREREDFYLADKHFRTVTTHASVPGSRRYSKATSWDKAADSYFGESKGKNSASSDRDGDPEGKTGVMTRDSAEEQKQPVRDWREDRSFSKSRASDRDREQGRRDGGNGSFGSGNRSSSEMSRGSAARRRDSSSNSREPRDSSEGSNRWRSSSDVDRRNFDRKTGYEGGNSERRGGYLGGRRFDKRPGYEGGNSERILRGYETGRSGTGHWQRSAPAREEGFSNGRGASDNRTRPSEGVRRARENGENRWNDGGASMDRAQDERDGEGEDWRWQRRSEWGGREASPPLLVEGQPVYGVAPIISALQASRRTFHALYMQENLAQNLATGKRKDKQAVIWIEQAARSMGVTVKEASKHDLNMLVDNRPHQGLVLDASPLEMVPVDMLEAPVYQGERTPVWVALDEITDPQNFGAILRSAYYLGAEGVVVCAKNSAPLSGVVSKASAGALEAMEVQYCRNMVKFLDRSRENGWRVVGGSSESSSMPVRELPRGVATILVLGNEGRGMRTNVKRACDVLVSIAGTTTAHRRLSRIAAEPAVQGEEAQEDEDEDFDLEGDDEDEDEDDGHVMIRRGAEMELISGPLAVDSLNVSVATGILLHELLYLPPTTDVEESDI